MRKVATEEIGTLDGLQRVYNSVRRVIAMLDPIFSAG